MHNPKQRAKNMRVFKSKVTKSEVKLAMQNKYIKRYIVSQP